MRTMMIRIMKFVAADGDSNDDKKIIMTMQRVMTKNMMTVISMIMCKCVHRIST